MRTPWYYINNQIIKVLIEFRSRMNREGVVEMSEFRMG